MKTKRILPIEVTVKTNYSNLQSNPDLHEYFFVYNIRIFNACDEAVQLMSRKWFISDSNGESRFVEGEGVVGEQPVIEPGGYYDYFSGCLLKTGFGKMRGFYMFRKLTGDHRYEVAIPEFHLVLPWIKN